MLKKLRLLLPVLLCVSFANAQSFNQYYADVIANYNEDTILTYLQEFEDLGIKGIGTQELDDAQNWIVGKYQSYGYQDITLDPFSYVGATTNNVIVKKEGCLYPNTYLIIDGHYDTKNGPGTNDNGSGTAIILELARILKDVPTNYSILFIHFSGEEDGLIGSTHYVNNTVVPTNMDIRLVFNIDEVGGVAGMTNNTITCEEDTGSPMSNNAASSQATAELATCVGLYSNLQTQISYAYSSDYMPFEDNGEIITGFYETNESTYPHSINDSLSKMDPVYVFEVGKAAAGGALHFAEGIAPTELTEVACFEFESPSGNYVWDATGLYYDTIPSALGCDSILKIDLTINSVDTQVSDNGGELESMETNAISYQWLDCDNGFSEILGETGSTISSTGNFAVKITTANCIDTSLCYILSVEGVNELDQNHVQIVPNPFTDHLELSFENIQGSKKVALMDLKGKLILSKETTANQIKLETPENLSKGYYLLKVTSEDGRSLTKKVLKQ